MKNKKYLIFIIVFIILLLAIVSTIFFVTKNNNNTNTKTPEQSGYTQLDNKQFLTTVGTWEQEGAPGIIMVFNEDGTGKKHY